MDDRLWIAGQDKSVRIYNLTTGTLFDVIGGFDDAVNDVSLHTVGGKKLLATSVGSRRFPSEQDWDDDSPHHTVDSSTKGWLCLYEIDERTCKIDDGEHIRQ